MLILSRRLGEQILIGDSILITVAAIRGERVPLEFTARVTCPFFEKNFALRSAAWRGRKVQSETFARL